MNPMVLEVAGRMGEVIERHAPIEFESGSLSWQDVPTQPQPYTRERLRVRSLAFSLPRSADIYELSKLHERLAGRISDQRESRFDREQEAVVSDQRILAI